MHSSCKRWLCSAPLNLFTRVRTVFEPQLLTAKKKYSNQLVTSLSLRYPSNVWVLSSFVLSLCVFSFVNAILNFHLADLLASWAAPLNNEFEKVRKGLRKQVGPCCPPPTHTHTHTLILICVHVHVGAGPARARVCVRGGGGGITFAYVLGFC